MSQLLVKGGSCVNPGGVFEADLLADQGRIVAIGSDLGKEAETVIDARGRLVLPGGIDVHVHMPWPAGDIISSDDFGSGTRGAAHGGVTTVLDFCIPGEEQDLVEALESKLTEAEGAAWVDYGLHLNIRGEVDSKIAAIPELVERGFPSFKVFMAYEGFRLEDRDLLRVMQAIAAAGGMLQVHAENGLLADHLTQELETRGETALADYPRARPPLCEVEAIHRVLAYARQIGARVHVHHVSTAQGAELIGRTRGEGLPVSGETCPHYLVFTSEEYAGEPRQAANLVCAPPIKTAQDRAGLWRALANGSLSMVATDHCPYTKAQKHDHLEDFTQVPGGMGGVETRLPLLYTKGVVEGRLSLSRFVEVWATEPARVFGLWPRKGAIAVGSDADLVILDPGRESVLRAAELHMNTECCPYEGWQVRGFPVTTVLRGQLLVDDGRLAVKQPPGRFVERHLA
jgi:dihydropyrimidinase